MKAVVTVLGKDTMGIIAGVSTYLSGSGVNILDISQTIMSDMFTMVMIIDTAKCNLKFSDLSKGLDELGKQLGVEITVQREELFNSMHRI
ncbi:MAG: ACT domain-containing protein [Bacillota bacterium]|nr:ACT domain-containing protein [Bacillota bacterium]